MMNFMKPKLSNLISDSNFPVLIFVFVFSLAKKSQDLAKII